MTVSVVALLPRQWPAHSTIVSHILISRPWDKLTILSSAVLVRIIATEQHTRPVGVDNTIIPTNRRSSRSVTKVLLLELRLISPSEEMVFCVLS